MFLESDRAWIRLVGVVASWIGGLPVGCFTVVVESW